MAGTETLTHSLARPACTTVPEPSSIRHRRKTRSRPELQRGIRAGAWKVEHELGRGGMASVHAVVHAKFGKRAALKIAHAAILGSPFTSETFLREARIANRIDHPGVTGVFATGSYDGRPYLVMERLVGETLGARLDRGPMERREAIEILLELCDVLGAAHTAGVVHRDLKLDNVFLLDAPGSGGRRVKLLDWGVASILDEADPLAGFVAGTLTYVAPEQVRGEDLTPAADLYSLAVLAFQLLLGEPPFAAQEDLELIRKHLHGAPPAPSSLWAEIPADLEALLLGMLAKRAEDRPMIEEVVQVLTRMRRELAPIAAKRRAVPVHARWLGAAVAIVAALGSFAALS